MGTPLHQIVFCLLRVSGFVSFLPPLGGQPLPNRVKIGLVLALTAFWAPITIAQSIQSESVHNASSTDSVAASRSALQGNAERDLGWLAWAYLAAREVALGATLGWMCGLVLMPVRIAGAYIASEMGLSMASLTSPTDTSGSNVLSGLLEAVTLLTLYTMNWHHVPLRMFHLLLHGCPVGQAWHQLPDSASAVRLLTALPARGLEIAAPMAVVLIGVLVAMTFATKQSPQFNLLSFGIPFRLLAGLLALVVLFPELLHNIALHLQQFVTGLSAISGQRSAYI